MTKKEQVAIARDIKLAFKRSPAAEDIDGEALETVHYNVASNIASTIGSFDHTFDSKWFLDACGVD
jgi:hypothetical protein